MSFRHFVPKSLADYCPLTKSCVGTIYRPQTRNRPKMSNRRIQFFPCVFHPLWVPDRNFRDFDAHIVFFDIFQCCAKFPEYVFFGQDCVLKNILTKKIKSRSDLIFFVSGQDLGTYGL